MNRNQSLKITTLRPKLAKKITKMKTCSRSRSSLSKRRKSHPAEKITPTQLASPMSIMHPYSKEEMNTKVFLTRSVGQINNLNFPMKFQKIVQCCPLSRTDTAQSNTKSLCLTSLSKRSMKKSKEKGT